MLCTTAARQQQGCAVLHRKLPDSVIKDFLVVQEWKGLHRDLSLCAEELERDPNQCFRQKHAHAASAGDRPVSK